ncbi:N-acetyltransferase [Rudaeicoccus suwonensis]|uniref:N-acetyltransferase n=1 Tax=Rudaeicoccus suwonensis TaxID=657409 RepID=A0A561E3U7_9MICO|nr:N-acetyltransferase [Rudaeicoccus suwonensis]TWE10287.1 hypothetical protein BKA23_2642 [Rudaeicoccus suwonensis]
MRFVTLAERPDLVPAMWQMGNNWPTFMQQDRVGRDAFGQLPAVFPEWQQLLLDDDRIVGRVNAIPFSWVGTDDDLPDDGWAGVIQRGFAARREGVPPTAISLLEARLVPALLGAGHARTMLEEMGSRVIAAGMRDLFGPVRPTGKHREPHRAMDDYARATRADGLPVDPWLRSHVRMGGRIVKVAPTSMAIAGSLSEWRDWTGLAFDASGPTVVPFACNPIHVDLEQDHAVYVEPNVWVHHDLRGR